MYLSVSWFETFTNKTKTTFKKLIEEESSQVIVCDVPPRNPHDLPVPPVLQSRRHQDCLRSLSPPSSLYRPLVTEQEPLTVPFFRTPCPKQSHGVRSFCGSRHILDYPSSPSSLRLRETRVLPPFFFVSWSPIRRTDQQSVWGPLNSHRRVDGRTLFPYMSYLYLSLYAFIINKNHNLWFGEYRVQT
jgi:hypothetical protein